MSLKSALKALKLNESTISMILGAIVIVVVGILVVNYFAGQKEGETIPPIDIEEISLPTTHTTSEGEDLWSISEKYYGTGYNWVDIAQENEISNPNEIEVGLVLTIPDVKPKLAQETEAASPTPEPEIVKNGQATHFVQANETLWSIAEKYYDSGYNWVDIVQANDLSSTDLEVGQKLTIPSVESKLATIEVDKTPTENKQDAILGATYTVLKGDHLWVIAIRAYGDGYRWVDIAQENNLANPNLIHPGNKLTLPR